MPTRSGPNSIATGGDDVINAGGGNDEVYGDAGSGVTGHIGVGGNDRIYGESGNDRLHGDGGADTLDGGTQSDTLYGGDGNDWLSGGADNDTLHGDAGDDQLDGGGGGDFMGGLTGNDTYFVNDSGDVVYELAGFGIDTVWSTLATTTAWANVEIVRYNGVGNFTGIGNGAQQHRCRPRRQRPAGGRRRQRRADRRRRRRRADRRRRHRHRLLRHGLCRGRREAASQPDEHGWRRDAATPSRASRT